MTPTVSRSIFAARPPAMNVEIDKRKNFVLVDSGSRKREAAQTPK
eukprot:CAMPEP_0175422966 /NCGR_PEP_ID=MMETSP0095-20121207/48021_1 /TAXON_ID=311494 /ORGANISM="Alexandrium monilatum, Strain CCMP3105" /LENGTH=44 /DNA_ID= /DNA_START= /DNA_END= /DNA_ORIENTATION=